jgi:hypothetical protein
VTDNSPAGREVEVSVATPLLFRVPEPKEVPLALKFTEPVGIAVPEAGVTVAVKVIDPPKTMVVAEALSAVVVVIF